MVMDDETGTGVVVGVSFELTPEEWVEVSLEHTARSEFVRAAMRRIRGLYGAIVGLGALLAVLGGSPPYALVVLLAGGLAFAFLEPSVRRARRNQFAQFAEKGIANGMFGPHRVELRPEGMLDATEGYEWLTRWSAIDRVEEGEGAFLIYTGPNAFLPIPHSAFRDSATLRRFSETFFSRLEAGRALGAAHGPVSDEAPAVTPGAEKSEAVPDA
jgi:hypothetical protein